MLPFAAAPRKRLCPLTGETVPAARPAAVHALARADVAALLQPVQQGVQVALMSGKGAVALALEYRYDLVPGAFSVGKYTQHEQYIA